MDIQTLVGSYPKFLSVVSPLAGGLFEFVWLFKSRADSFGYKDSFAWVAYRAFWSIKPLGGKRGDSGGSACGLR